MFLGQRILEQYLFELPTQYHTNRIMSPNSKYHELSINFSTILFLDATNTNMNIDKHFKNIMFVRGNAHIGYQTSLYSKQILNRSRLIIWGLPSNRTIWWELFEFLFIQCFEWFYLNFCLDLFQKLIEIKHHNVVSKYQRSDGCKDFHTKPDKTYQITQVLGDKGKPSENIRTMSDLVERKMPVSPQHYGLTIKGFMRKSLLKKLPNRRISTR